MDDSKTEHARPGASPPTADGLLFADEIRLLDSWRLLARRRHVVLGALGIALVITALVTLTATRLYRATATLQIERHGPDILTHKDVVSVDYSYQAYEDFYQTQYKIVQSRAVLHLAAERLDLPNRPELAAGHRSPVARLRSWLGDGSGSDEPAAEEEPDPFATATDYLADGVRVQPVRNSHLVQIAFTDRDPHLARDAANAIAAAYQEFGLQARYDATAEASEFLTKQVLKIQLEIDAKERDLQAASARKDILALRDDTQDITSQALAELSQQQVAARARLALGEARWQTVRDAAPESLPEVLTSPLINALKQQYAEVERRWSQMAERFGDDWPARQQLEEELKRSAARLEVETAAIAAQVRRVAEADLERSRAEVHGLARRVEEQKDEVQRVHRDAIEVATLREEIDSRRQFLQELVARQSQTAVSDRLRDTQASNVRIVDAARLPEFPVAPRKRFNLAVGLLLGLVAGVGAAFLVEHLDNTVKTEQDLERIAGLAVFGHVPLFQPLRVVSPAPPAPRRHDLDPVGLAAHSDPRSPFAEAFRNLRTSLLLASPDRPPRLIVVTSCEAGDGKSTVSANLAVVLTQTGRRVLLVDADLRRPRLHRMLGAPNTLGLSSFITGNADFDDVLQETEVSGLTLVPSGPMPPNPSELLEGASFRAALERLRTDARFDHVIFDSPPVVQVTDSVIVATRADTTLVVTRAGRTSRESLVTGVSRLAQAHVHVAGAVLNAVSEQTGYYYGRHRYYRSEAEDVPGQDAAPRRFARFRRRGQSA